MQNEYTLYLVAVIGVIIGLLALTLGAKLFKFLIGFIGFFVGVFFGLSLVGSFLAGSTLASDIQLVFTVLVPLIMGAIFASLSIFFYHIGLGIILAYLAIILLKSIIPHIPGISLNPTLEIAIYTVFIIGTFLFGFVYDVLKPVVVFATSLYGASLIVTMIYLLIPGSGVTLANLQTGNPYLNTSNVWSLGYIVIVTLLTVAGVLIQLKNSRNTVITARH